MKVLIVGALMLGTAAPASAMTVQLFLEKAQTLQKRGPLALLSSDLSLLKKQVTADLTEIRKQRLAAEAARRPAGFCPPAGGVKMTDKDVVSAMEAVPPAQRASTSTMAALRAYFGRRFPCRS